MGLKEQSGARAPAPNLFQIALQTIALQIIVPISMPILEGLREGYSLPVGPAPVPLFSCDLP